MVETEIRTSEPKTNASATANSDATDRIDKVKDFISNVKEMAGKPMDVKAGSINFTVTKTKEGQYSLAVDTKFSEVTI